MGEPYLGEISLGGWNFAPHGFALCNGQLLPISQNTALFSLLGTDFGGDGQSTFALPDLRGRVPVHMGQGPGLSSYNIGQAGGAETVTLTLGQLPSHNHYMYVNSGGPTTSNPGGAFLASGPYTGSGPNATELKLYNPGNNGAQLNSSAIDNAGGNQGHSNIQPFLAVTYVIAMQGIYPSRN